MFLCSELLKTHTSWDNLSENVKSIHLSSQMGMSKVLIMLSSATDGSVQSLKLYALTNV